MSGSGRASRPLAGLLAALAFAGAAAADAPVRVVSMNLCTDQLAMMLAAPGQLVSVSDIATDPFTSPMWREAEAYPANSGRAEEIFLLDPDLVLAGVYSDPAVVSMLRRLGLRVEQLDIAATLEDIPDRIAEVAALLGRDAEGQSLIRRFETDLANLRNATEGGPVTAFYYPNGYTLGTETLSHEILTAAGFRNLSERLGRAQSGHLPLELLVMEQPDLIVTSDPYPGASRSEDLLDHPAIAELSGPSGPFRSGPDWVCGTPHVLSAVSALSARAP
ncbi:ABC transporter substrate-binding protein [Rhodobacterales bacterium HKCCE3408]|nr:ABC transporter substrate-binding protein [Rhodobacterales bacterium HKCCE3408]